MLVTVATYRRLTGDTTTIDGDVLAAIADSQELIEETLHRVGFLEEAEHTEYLPVIRGKAYPTATPVTEAPYEIQDAGRTLIGLDGYGTDLVLNTYEPYDGVGRASITYTGGYTAATCPMRLKEAICRTAYQQTHPASAVDANLVGAKSARVGDVSITYGDAGAGATISALTASVAMSIRGFRRQEP